MLNDFEVTSLKVVTEQVEKEISLVCSKGDYKSCDKLSVVEKIFTKIFK